MNDIENQNNMVFAGFWLRTLAYLIDYAILYVVMALFEFIFNSNSNTDPLSAYNIIFTLVCLAISMLYSVILESSQWQATIGKKLVKIKVTDESGNRISFGRATVRYFASYISAILFCAGYIMCAFTSKKQCLHDIIASTLVLYKY